MGGFPIAMLKTVLGSSPWLLVVVVSAALVLGLVQAIMPQNSADRLELLLALRRHHGSKVRNSMLASEATSTTEGSKAGLAESRRASKP
jgi:hypothetical protein